MSKVFILSLLLLCSTGFARSRPPVPLLPERPNYDASLETSARRRSVYGTNQWIGGTLGVTALSTNASGNPIGLTPLYGGSVFYRTPFFSRHVFFKADLGFYTSGQGTAVVGVSQRMGEVGATVLYVPNLNSRLRAQIGAVTKAEISFSDITVSNLYQGGAVGAVSPPAFSVRLGPTAGILYSVTRETTWLLDVEVTAPVQTPIRPYLGVNSGLMFRWD